MSLNFSTDTIAGAFAGTGSSILIYGPLALALFGVVAVIALKRRAAPYEAKQIVNATEGKLYSLLEKWRRENARHLNLSTQVSYGSFIGAKNKADWLRIASKHADFVFWGRDRYPKAVIEYDGAGHYGSSREAARKVKERDGIKNKAVCSANIPLIRIPANASERDIVDTLNRVLLPPAPTSVIGNNSAGTATKTLEGQ